MSIAVIGILGAGISVDIVMTVIAFRTYKYGTGTWTVNFFGLQGSFY